MKTYLSKQAKWQERKWYLIDAKDKILWRLAVKIADLLRWKTSPDFVNFIDNWAYVVVTNCDKISLTWNKADTKMYYRHSKYAKDWLKVQNASDKLTKQPEFVLRHAVLWMIPANKLRKDVIERLKLFTWEDHSHVAQQPEIISL